MSSVGVVIILGEIRLKSLQGKSLDQERTKILCRFPRQQARSELLRACLRRPQAVTSKGNDRKQTQDHSSKPRSPIDGRVNVGAWITA